MSCPTCSATMQCLYERDGEAAFWCPRCGTIKSPWLTSPDGEAPVLVARCRQFATLLPTVSLAPDRVAGEWKRLGIAESIHLPTHR